MHPTRRTVVRRSGLVAAGLLGTANAAAATSSGPAGTGRVDGTVTHFGRPVADATVRLGPNTSAVTGDDGAFALEVAPGTYAASVTADGYAPATREFDVLTGATTTMDVSLDRTWGPKTGTLDVAVTKAGGGKTIPCHITLFGDATEGVYAPRGAIPDGERWERELEVPEGWWEIRASNVDGYSDGYAEVYVAADETAFAWVQLTEGDDEIPDTGRLEARVVDRAGTAVEDAIVRVAGERTVVDETGTVELELAHGRYDIAASAPGYEAVTDEVPVKFGRTTAWTIVLESR